MSISKINFEDPSSKCVTKKMCIFFTTSFALLGLLFSFLVTYFVMKKSDSSSPPQLGFSPEFIRSKLFENIRPQQIEGWLRDLTEKPHIAGTADDKELAEYVLQKWKNMKLDASIVTYDVLLSYNNPDKPNMVRIVDQNNIPVFSSQPYEDPLGMNDTYYKSNPPFLAYANSTPENQPIRGELVYVNYGRAEDYETLRQLNISVTDKIVIARFGKIFRGNILKFAEDNGAIGLIGYTDPFDYTDGNLSNVYPHSVFLPSTGAQRGSTIMRDGDPLTPGYPSIESAYRIPEADAILPKIPGHCISYGDARNLLVNLTGPAAPEEWKGGLDINYNIGPGFSNANTVTLEVNTRLETKPIYNIIGIIRGCEEPDRYVLVGNHRDDWSFGAVDPHSGTAAILGLSEAVSTVVNEYSWCPRRSIVFGSWGGEEYALTGSHEWVQENQKLLLAQAVAYINVDSAVTGNYTLAAGSTPLLYSALWDASEKVSNPDQNEINSGRQTVFDTWAERNPWNFSGNSMARITAPSGSSDYRPFLQISGVPIIDMWYRCELVICNPNYHTMYETFNLQQNLMDRGFLVNKAVAQVWAELVRSLSDTPLLPFSIEYYPVILRDSINEIVETNEYQQVFQSIGVNLDNLSASVESFESAVMNFVEELKSIDLTNPLLVRRANDILMLVERAFIDDQGLPINPTNKHVILAPSALNSYRQVNFPGIHDLLWQYMEAESKGEQSETAAIAEQLKKHISIVVFHVTAAKQFVSQSWF